MNTNILNKVESANLKKVPELRPGDVVRVHQKIKEGNKERVQIFEGVVLRVKAGGVRGSFLVRKMSFGIGVEKNFPLHSPNIAKIEIKKRSKVRQAYLTYLRKLTGKSARLKDKQFDMLAVNIKEESVVEEAPAAEAQTESAVTDAEITELSDEEMTDAEKMEEPLEDLEKAEEKQNATDEARGQDTDEADHQVAEEEEIEEGIERAEAEEAKTEDSIGERAEEAVEEAKPQEEDAK